MKLTDEEIDAMMAAREAEASCSRCRHSRPALSDDGETPLLKCHRYPATVFMLGDEVAQTYPEADEPCGEYSQVN